VVIRPQVDRLKLRVAGSEEDAAVRLKVRSSRQADTERRWASSLVTR
jgi:hypothetical protein